VRRVRRFFGTQNHYPYEDIDGVRRPVLFRLLRENERIVYSVAEAEVGEGGTPHVQFYFEVSSRGAAFTIAQVQQWPTFAGQGCALFAARGNRAQATAYCTKEANPAGWVQIHPPHNEEVNAEEERRQGQRNDWRLVHDLARAGAQAAEFAEQVPHLAYRHIQLIPQWVRIHHQEVPREHLTRMVCFYGLTGAGKTERALREASIEANGMENVYVHNSDRRWFDGYRAQPVMMIDEFNGSFFSFDEIKRLLSRVPYRLEQRGVHGGAQLVARTIYVTSNHHPRYWYEGVGSWDDRNPLLRRLKEFCEVYYLPQPIIENGVTVYQEPVRDLLLGAGAPETSAVLLAGLEAMDEYERDYREARRGRRNNGEPVRRFDFGINSE